MLGRTAVANTELVAAYMDQIVAWVSDCRLRVSKVTAYQLDAVPKAEFEKAMEVMKQFEGEESEEKKDGDAAADALRRSA